MISSSGNHDITYKRYFVVDLSLFQSNFSFCHSVFKRFVLHTCKVRACLGTGYLDLHISNTTSVSRLLC